MSCKRIRLLVFQTAGNFPRVSSPYSCCQNFSSLNMTPRTKLPKEKPDWLECINCRLIVSAKDVIIHGETCHKFNDSGNLMNNQNLGHGFIQNNIFHAVQVDLPTKVTGDVLKELPQLTQKSLILIHPSTLKFCRMGIGDHVFLQGADFNSLHIAWPSQSVNPSSVFVVNVLVKQKRLLTVKPFMGQIVDAGELVIRVDKDTPDNSTLSKQFAIQNSNLFIKPGSVLNCNYFGQPISSFIMSISDGINIHYEIPDTNTDALTNMIDSLDLSESALSDLSDSFELQSPKSPHDTLRNFRPAQPSNILDNSTNTLVYFKITLDTKVIIYEKESSTHDQSSIDFDAIGGLYTELGIIKSQIELFFKKSDVLYTFGVNAPRGVLLFGPSGTGKSMILQAIQNEFKDLNMVFLKPSEIFSKFYGETEKKLKTCFENASKRAPSLLIIDEIDLICDKGEKQLTDLERRILSGFLALIDDLQLRKGRVLILAATNRIDQLSSALRQPGRFDKEIEIPVPNSIGRCEILMKQLKHIPNDLSNEDIKIIAENLHSYTGADIACIVREAGELLMKFEESEITQEDFSLNKNHLIQASRKVKPTAMKEVTIEVPKVLWTDIGGMVKVKHRLKQAIEWPLKHPEAFQRLGIKAPRGLLMYGPPGCSKTMIAKALATESGLNFLAIKGPELFNKWVGESERAIRELFRKAKGAAPSIIFFDEIDALAGERGSSSGGSNVGNRVLAQLLTEIDGVELLEGVTIVAATNRPDMIDKALLRPGRLDSVIYVPLPDDDTRKDVFQIQFNKMPIASDVNIADLVQLTDGYSGAEIVALCQEAGLSALTESLDCQEISRSHFEKALTYVKPRTSKESLKFYAEYYDKNSAGISKLKTNCGN